MSKRDEILSYCKFYKGEEKCPYEEWYASLFWEYEQGFVHKYELGLFKNAPIDTAFSDYMIGVFEHLATLHDTMDDGAYFRDKYFSVKAVR